MMLAHSIGPAARRPARSIGGLGATLRTVAIAVALIAAYCAVKL